MLLALPAEKHPTLQHHVYSTCIFLPHAHMYSGSVASLGLHGAQVRVRQDQHLP